MLTKLTMAFVATLVLGSASLVAIEAANAAPRVLQISPSPTFPPANERARDKLCATGCN